MQNPASAGVLAEEQSVPLHAVLDRNKWCLSLLRTFLELSNRIVSDSETISLVVWSETEGAIGK